MNAYCVSFLDRMACLWLGVAKARKETERYWTPEEPPLTEAFSEVGHRIVDDMALFDSDTKRSIMELIEEGMESLDEPLGTAVATGLIEGMIGRAAHVDGKLNELLSDFGPLSRAHATAWIEF